jgi:hypothetical protein
MYNIFEKIKCKLVTSKTIGQGAAAPRRCARRVSADLAVRARSPPDAPLRPRPTAFRGYAPAEAALAPQHVGVSAAPRAGAPRAPCYGRTRPLRTGGPSAFPPLACAVLRPWITSPSPPGRASLFKCRHFPPLRATRAAALHCRRRW